MEIKQLAKIAAEAWSESIDFDQQADYLIKAQSIASLEEYTDALQEINAYSLREWVERNW